MGVIRTAVRVGRKASHHTPTKKAPAANHARPAPTADPYAASDRANLADLQAWATQVKPRPEKAQAVPDEAPLAQATTADRPRNISEMVGQEELRNQLAIVCAGTRLRGKQMAHVLISGPAGYGKTSLAGIIASELGWHLIEANGMTLRKPQDLVGILMKAEPNTVMLIDEVHALARPVMEQLYEVLEDGRITTTMGSGTEATAYTHRLQGFVCVGATTRPGLLTIPMKDRFGAQFTMAEYATDELGEIVRRAWVRQGVAFTAGEEMTVAERCKGVPRRALHLSDRVLDYCAVQRMETVEAGAAGEALDAFHIDAYGLDDTDFRVLEALTSTYAGKTVGLDALATYLDVDQKTLQNDHEPFLTRSGFIARAKSGRMATPEGYELMRQYQQDQDTTAVSDTPEGSEQ